MNERIRELWNQSRYPSGRGHDEEKFARLIVRECANQLPRISEEYYTGDGIVEDAQKLILEHFGVKP